MEIDPALVRLHLAPGLTPRGIAVLLARYGAAAAVLAAPPGEVAALPGAGPAAAAALQEAPPEREARAHLRRVERAGLSVVALGAPEYPPRLAEIHDPPLLLYVRGVPGPEDEAVAVVGARRASVYGRAVAERLGGGLARAGVTVVSGLARGADAAAHRGALSAGGRTVAVLGCGLDRVYPPEHEALAREVAGSGALLSEFPPGVPPLAHHFPMRNRIIAGLSRAVVVVESRLRSGSLITANLAGEAGKPVFAVPGSVDSELSRGPHALIRDGAALVEGPDQLLVDLGYRPLESLSAAPPPEDPLQRRILEALPETEAVGLEALLRGLSVPAPPVLAALLGLELGGFIRSLPGRRYARAPPGAGRG